MYIHTYIYKNIFLKNLNRSHYIHLKIKIKTIIFNTFEYK